MTKTDDQTISTDHGSEGKPKLKGKAPPPPGAARSLGNLMRGVVRTGELERYGLTTREINRITDEQIADAVLTFENAIASATTQAREIVRASLKKPKK